MKEVTIITTVEVTQVLKDVPDCFEVDKETVKADITSKIKEVLNVDDVVATNVQEFIRNAEE